MDATAETLAVLEEAPDARLAFEYGRWLLMQDLEGGLAAFKSKRAAELDAEEVLEYLQHYGVPALISYLEHLLYERGVEEEALHTKLGVYCIDLLQAAQAPMQEASARKRGRGRTRVPEQSLEQAALLTTVRLSLSLSLTVTS